MSSPLFDFRTTNALWCSVLAEALVQGGVRQVVLSPGSRSAPLTLALAQHPQLEALAVLDERSAAFFALGLARQTQRPVVLGCTSGTAAANYYPAVVEAFESGVPLVVLTADRPPELRACSSGQTIDQQKLYGGFVTFHHELAVPEATLPRLAYLRQTVAQALARAQGPSAGPVHLNCPFRDPLVPVGEEATARALASVLGPEFFAPAGVPEIRETTLTVDVSAWPARGVIVAGPERTAEPAAYAQAVRALAAALGWPVLADALSPVRQHLAADEVVTAYDALLREPARARALQPDRILCLGGWPTSKVLRAWVGQSPAEIVLLTDTAHNRDSLHGRTRHWRGTVGQVRVRGARAADPAYGAAWRQAERAARQALDTALANITDLLEPKAAWLLAHQLPERTPVVVANSMPVRDLEYFWPATARRLDVFFNRGANGIDGTLSTALGVAHGGRPTVLLTGDLSFLHDTNGLLLRPILRGSLTIVLIDNRGGGIFEHLPVAQFDPPFEQFFATPQAVDFAALCAAHGVAYVPVADWAQFTALMATLPPQGVRVLAVATERKRDAAWRQHTLAAAALPS